ncbi:hypothetical protein [Aquibacillus saliphilus]|uniref:hypothetical protein n=1 Tax=Aquibacillus saliphilus TaxID=1909422 RepID=UPI001CF005A4|nr:hypothetical protein [Aquibacillus saliphilus]
MKRRIFQQVILVVVIILLTACKNDAVNEQELIGEDLEQSMVVAEAKKTRDKRMEIIKEQNTATNEAELIDVNLAEIVVLMEEIETVQRQVIATIEDNGWYESIDKIEPLKMEFEAAIAPVVSRHFTKTFINEVIISQMERFFCYCDAASPLEGGMKLDVTEGVKQINDDLSFFAYRPANEINTGVKFKVELVLVDGKWKIDQWNPVLNSHEHSFAIMPEEIIEYYAIKGITLKLIEKVEGGAYKEEVYIFETDEDNQLLAIGARDWHILEGTEQIESIYQ